MENVPGLVTVRTLFAIPGVIILAIGEKVSQARWIS